MLIAITKKLADAIGIKVETETPEVNPLFQWTANWINTFANRKEDTIVLFNSATQFTVAIYGIKRTQFKDIQAKIITAIRNTLISMSLNEEMVDDYLLRAGELTFVKNSDKRAISILNHKCRDAAFVVGRYVNSSMQEIKYEDTLGRIISRRIAGYSGNPDGAFYPSEKMIEALTELTSKSAFKYRAFELLVTLDLEIYKAVRRIIVPADLKFKKLHEVLQDIFDWESYHLYDFSLVNEKSLNPPVTLVPDEESLDYDENAVLINNCKLSDYMPMYKRIIYTYDMGDNWEHQIELVRIIEEHNEESPYLLEMTGQAPPEDVGGVGGYIEFYEIMKDKNHPRYTEMKEWVGRWNPELWDWQTRPKLIDI
jgi:hypothetical protein